MDVPNLRDDERLELRMPVWSPGSYKVREYSRHLQNFVATDRADQPLEHEKLDKATWAVDCAEVDRALIRYEIYAHTLNVREKHVDGSHAFYQPTAVYLYPAGRLDSKAELRVDPPREDWSVYCGLESVPGESHRWRAPDFDTLFDAPVEMGDHSELEFDVDGAPHTVAFWGEGDWDRDRLGRDLPQIVSANAELFGGVPYDDYTFITLLSAGAYGGLEHRNSTALIYPKDEFGPPPEDRVEPPIDDDDYLNFLSLVAHEHFHAWNVKRLFPAALEEIDYQTENYVPELWTVEGITSFYDRTALYRAGLIDADRFLEFFAERIAKYENTPGREVQSLREAGFDAWVKLYLSDEQTINSTVSYYLKGALVAFALDLRLRRATDGERSLDDVLLGLWERYGREAEHGYPEGAHRELAEEIAGQDLGDFFERYVHGTAPFDWKKELGPFGLELRRRLEEDSPECWLGIDTKSGNQGARVTRVRSDGPSTHAGIYPGDEILAVDGWIVEDPDAVDERLDQCESGATVTLHLARRGKLQKTEVSAERRPPDSVSIGRQPELDNGQRRLLESWLGTDEVDVIDEQAETNP